MAYGNKGEQAQPHNPKGANVMKTDQKLEDDDGFNKKYYNLFVLVSPTVHDRDAGIFFKDIQSFFFVVFAQVNKLLSSPLNWHHL